MIELFSRIDGRKKPKANGMGFAIVFVAKVWHETIS